MARKVLKTQAAAEKAEMSWKTATKIGKWVVHAVHDLERS